MSLSIPPQITTPFATAGLRAAIPPTANNVTGRAGYDQGFPPINLTPKIAGGIPPFGQDMNGTLYDATRAIQFTQAGSGFVYNSAFATAIGGYRPGARVLRTDGLGYWLNTIDGNTADPEAAGAAAAGWVPDYTYDITSLTMTNANVTLTPLQYGKRTIIITGVLTANLNLILPTISGQWVIANRTTGNFTITAKTVSGSGVVLPKANSALVYCDLTNILFASSATATGTEQSLTTDGFQKFPGGLIMQWGAGSGSGPVVFPIAFPSGSTPIVTFGGATSGGHFYTALSASGMTVSSPGGTSFRYIAVGW